MIEILLIETLVSALNEWPGTNVTCAYDGVVGAARLREKHFDLALIDGILWGQSGIQLAHVAAAENTSVLILSGHPDVNQEAAALGIRFLPKPFSMIELLPRSSAVLAERPE